MMQYLRAEFGLCKKNKACFILGICWMFVFCMLLLFSGVGGIKYAGAISVFGFIGVIFFLIPWFLSPASFFENRKKICISAEHMALMLGESKRTFVKNKIVVCVGHCVLVVCFIALMQIPACLIAGEQYSLLVLWTELVTVLGFSLFTMVILFLCPSHKMMLGLPLWSGFCGGIAGGILGDMNDMTDEIAVFRSFAAIMIVGSVAFILAVLYRYIKTVCEERRGRCVKER